MRLRSKISGTMLALSFTLPMFVPSAAIPMTIVWLWSLVVYLGGE